MRNCLVKPGTLNHLFTKVYPLLGDYLRFIEYCFNPFAGSGNASKQDKSLFRILMMYLMPAEQKNYELVDDDGNSPATLSEMQRENRMYGFCEEITTMAADWALPGNDPASNSSLKTVSYGKSRDL
jgi:hypothetical protein